MENNITNNVVKNPKFNKGDKVIYIKQLYSSNVYEIINEPLYDEKKDNYMYTVKQDTGRIYPVLLDEEELYIYDGVTNPEEAITKIKEECLAGAIEYFNNVKRGFNHETENAFSEILKLAACLDKQIVISVK